MTKFQAFFASLTPTQQQVLKLRYGLGDDLCYQGHCLSQDEVAVELSTSHYQVESIERQIFRKLKEYSWDTPKEHYQSPFSGKLV
jgi:DNA-directed RNA polymerase sigma subunit (sigma70/sigma32)